MPSSHRSKARPVAKNSDSEDLPLAIAASKSKSISPSKKLAPKRKIKKEKDEDEENSSNEDAAGVRKKQRLLSPWPASPDREKKHNVENSPGTSKRVPKLSQKVKYMKDVVLSSDDEARLSDDEKPSSRKGKKIAMPTIKKPNFQNYVEIDDSSEVETSEGQFEEELKTPSKGKKYKESKDLQVPVKDEKQKQVTVNLAMEPTRSAKLYPQDIEVPPDSDYDNQEDVEPVITDLMPLEKQDPKLRADYINLPEIPYKEMHSFYKGNHATEEYSLVWGALKTDDDPYVLRRLRTAVRFTHSLPFVNASRIPLSMVQREADRVILASTLFKKQSAVFLTTGVVSYCQLITPGNSLTTGGYKVKQIFLCPFGIEYERASAFIGGALDVNDYVGQLSDGNLIFVTRGETYSNAPTGVTSPGPSTPSKGRKAINFKKTPALSFPASLNFTDDVPIYDIRQNSNFAFTADDLANLRHLPLYEQGISDLPPETLATVGYTVGCYPYRASNPSLQGYTVITLNVLFVIALGSVDRVKLAVLSEKMSQLEEV